MAEINRLTEHEAHHALLTVAPADMTTLQRVADGLRAINDGPEHHR
ncbi:hypothetical protein [Nocardia callitridis]|uniref:Uncharacterized protein n=1 Tax=Nocardia callitridis TaxID=648753 RepID=A0ABP9JUG0_9NOCA